MISEEEEVDEPPIVEYAYLPKNYFDNSDEEEDKVQKIINEYNSKNKMPKIFGEDNLELNNEIKKKIYNFYLNKYSPNNNNKKENQNKEKDDNIEEIPMTHVCRFPHTKKTLINSIDIDNKNNRLVTGGSDGIVKIWDFNSLTRKPKPNHSVDCSEEKDFPIVSVSWSPSGGDVDSLIGNILNVNYGVKDVMALDAGKRCDLAVTLCLDYGLKVEDVATRLRLSSSMVSKLIYSYSKKHRKAQ